MPLNQGINITSIAGTPSSGWPIAAHCDHCRETVITWSPYATKPADGGDLWQLTGTCLDESLGMHHNLYAHNGLKKPWYMEWGERLGRVRACT